MDQNEQQIEVHEFRRSFSTIDGERRELSMKLKFHDMRSIKDRREQVMELFYTHKSRICDIAFVMKIPKTTVRRWVKYPETRRQPGRPTYLDPEDTEKLFSTYIAERTSQQDPPSPHEVVEEVSRSLIYVADQHRFPISSGDKIEKRSNRRGFRRAS